MVLSITRSTQEQRRRVAEQERRNLARAAALRAQEERAQRARVEARLREARAYIRTDELLQEYGCPVARRTLLALLWLIL